jgi:hypothetical protein
MVKYVIALAVLSLVVVTAQVQRQTAQTELKQKGASDAEIDDAIRELPTQSWEHSLEVFYKNPGEATKLLIAELEPIKRSRYPGGTHPQAVWIVRALRSLTGLDFTATTRARLSDDEAHFLRVSRRGEVEFFGTWMSRDSDWVAPMDAQVAIIKKWREWYARSGHTYSYMNDRDLDDWYF